MSVAAIILAAGASRRLGQPKQLLMFQGETLLDRTIRLADEAGAEPIAVVLGASYNSILSSIQLRQALPVMNERWEEGLASSIRSGLSAITAYGQAAGALFLTCDQPMITAEHLRVLIACFNDSGAPVIVASQYAGTTGIPSVFPREVFSHLAALQGDKGAHQLLAGAPCPVNAVPLAQGEIDIDSASDLPYIA